MPATSIIVRNQTEYDTREVARLVRSTLRDLEGRCTAWMAGLGPCMLDANHEGDHWSQPCR